MNHRRAALSGLSSPGTCTALALLLASAACGSGAGTPSGTGGGAGGGAGTSGSTGAGGSAGSSGSAGSAGASGSTGAGGSAGAGGAAGGAPGPCGAIATFADGRAPTREVFVAMNGSASGDGSSASPVDTVARGIALATPGTAVRIRPGTYAGGAFVSGISGTATAPIWIGGVAGQARPIIEGGADAMHLVRPRYLVLHDLEVRGQTANGINVDDGSQYADPEAARFVVFQNLFIHDIGSGGNQDCLKLSGLNDFFVVDSRFERCGGGGSGSAVDHVGCHRGVLARNVLADLAGNGIQCKGGSEDIEIRWNRMTNAGERAVNMGGSTGVEFFRPPLSTTAPNVEARNIRVIANVLVGSTSPLAFVGCVDCLAAHNTIVDPTRWIVRVLQESVTTATHMFLPAQRGQMVNNLVYFSRASLSTHVNVGGNTDAATFTFRNNLWYAHDMPAQSMPSLPAAETAGLYGQDPRLVAPASGDYALMAGSPAAGAGTPLANATGDASGRCYLNPPSIGALER